MPVLESKMFPGRVEEVPPPLQEIDLIVTADHILVMRDNKAVGFLPMHPLAHLALTTSDEEHLQELISPHPDRKGDKIPLAIYNEWTEAGKSIIPPFLRVQMSDGKVVGHEGRHRAAALYREDPDALMWVAIELIDEHGYAVYYEEPRYEPGQPSPREQRRYLDRSDVPEIFWGQFRPTSVEVDPAEMWLIPR